MTEPESFEEDLFADLYDDNEAPKASAPAPETGGQSADNHEAQIDNARHESETFHQPDHAEQADHAADDDDDDDDEVDFNLGGGSGNAMPAMQQIHDAPSTPPYGTVHKASAKEDGKMFIGGLNWETTDESLRDYFAQFGEVVECTVMRDSSTGRSRGFGFLTFKDAKTVNIVMVKEHFLDGKIIDPKRAIPRDEQEKTSKIFVGGVSQETTDQEFKDYFAQFGRVVDATLMMDKDTGRPRGFGFVTFESEAGVDACINVPLEIHGKPVEVKKAQPRGNLREEEEAAKRNKFRKGDEQTAQGGMGQQMGNNGMTPQVMAQYFQRMQQYFAMMQNQMAMSRGVHMNPAMWQNMVQMQQMQQMMGRGGGGGNPQNMMGNMNPQMMQQMQQQMQQQQQMMQQQQQQQQQQPWAAAHPAAHRRPGKACSPDPQNAPPANAPTGPKNAGRPGANYRGGGRGGNRGFHPYAR
ncbi:hypothetical protein HIM_02099 [Hirsutella minnesotensis 3608]|nr:hypothetical protein HIM_02099 [Hirsutella minnesotensis 3608]